MSAKKETIQNPKGMHDIFAKDYYLYEHIYNKAVEIVEYYGFQPIKTPHLEKIDIFTATLGETSDLIEKQMYALKARGKEHLVLRPEGTAPIIRSYIANGMHTKPQPVMLYYKGSFFRHERPQKGRLREFQQFGLEIVGEDKSIAEALIMKMFVIILEKLGLDSLVVHVNSLGDKDCRNIYRKELIAYYRKHLNKVCKDCQNRIKKNPLRLLDCKEEQCQPIKKEAPQIMSFLCSPCRTHFKNTLELLDSFEVPYIVDHTLVRGLDYYSRTVFEIFQENNNDKENEPEAKIKKTISLGGGGRYDELGKILGKKEIPATGGAIGVERILDILKEKNISPRKKHTPKIFFIQIGALAKSKSILVMEKFRKAEIPVGQSFAKESLQSQINIALKLKISYAVILGQKEALENTIIIRNMDTDSQETVSLDKVVEAVKKKLKS